MLLAALRCAWPDSWLLFNPQTWRACAQLIREPEICEKQAPIRSPKLILDVTVIDDEPHLLRLAAYTGCKR